MNITEELLAAYADGELSDAERDAVEAAIAADPLLAHKVESHRALADKLGTHFAPIMDQPVPDRLMRLLQSEDQQDQAKKGSGVEIVSFAREREKRGLAPTVRRWAPFAGPALAASLMLAIWQPWQSGELGEGYASTALAAALDNQLVAEQPSEAETRILLSFRNKGGDYCRAFRAQETGGIACRDDNGWQVRREYALDGAQTTEYRQAGSESDLLAAAQDMAAGEALDAAAEAQAKAAGWR